MGQEENGQGLPASSASPTCSERKVEGEERQREAYTDCLCGKCQLVMMGCIKIVYLDREIQEIKNVGVPRREMRMSES